MSRQKNNNIMEKLKEAFEDLLPSDSKAEYPPEAMPVGTIVRSTRLDKLGFIADAFYGDLDENNTKIIVYTILLLPNVNPFTKLPVGDDQYYISNEYEYEVVGYLMMNPVNMKQVSKMLNGGLYF